MFVFTLIGLLKFSEILISLDFFATFCIKTKSFKEESLIGKKPPPIKSNPPFTHC